MSDPRHMMPQSSKVVQISMFLFIAAGIAGYQVVARSLFPLSPGGGLNVERIFWAGIVGMVCGMTGALVGVLIDRLHR